MRKTMAAYLGHTERSTKQLRQAAQTIKTQNVSLEQANRLLRERSTAAMESLSATVDARDAHGRPLAPRAAARAAGRELGLSQAESTCSDMPRSSMTSASSPCPDAIL